jgi:DNA (cytosine-5)-methyltransferase 1
VRHGSLFSGIGGFDLAAEWMGWENVFHCEWNPFGQKILHYYWPQAIQYNDITQTDFTIHRGRIDILTGGFPCQPYSMAGKRKGKEDERHLWPEMLRAIREIAPRYIVGENVLGLVNWDGGLVFDEVQADLESAGYEVATVVIPAAAVNAPHGRDRVWFVAKNTMHSGCVQREFGKERTGVREQRDTCAGDTERICGAEMAGFTANTEQQRRKEWRQIYGWPHTKEDKTGLHNRIERFSNDGITANTNSASSQCWNGQTAQEWKKQGRRIESFSEHTSWQEFPTQSPICGGDDGLPAELDGITFPKWRNESIKGYGNAIVPQVAFEIFKAIERADAL